MMNGKDCTILALEKNNKKMKRVSFDSNIKIQHMHVWAFAYQEARKSEWMRFAADRYRFELRKHIIEAMLTKIRFFSRK